jgi:predicted HicB family RNase H-like nuclease
MKIHYRGYVAHVAYSKEDGCLVGEVPYLQNTLLAFDGQTPTEVEQRFHEAIDDYLTLCAEAGETPETQTPVTLTLHITERAQEAAKRASASAHMPLEAWASQRLEAALLEA